MTSIRNTPRLDLPTLGDRPGGGPALDTTEPTPRRRRGRHVALFVVAVLALASLGATAASAGGSFSDVPDSHPFASEINWMAAKGIAQGYPDGTYKPASPVTRQSAAAFFAKYNASIATYSSTSSLSGPSHEWVKTASCPSGMRPIAGGGSAIAGVYLYLSASYPTPTGWAVRFMTQNNVNVSDGTARVYVTCMPDDSATEVPIEAPVK